MTLFITKYRACFTPFLSIRLEVYSRIKYGHTAESTYVELLERQVFNAFLLRLKSLNAVQLWFFILLFLIYFLLEAAVREGRTLIEEAEYVARLPLLPSTFVDI